MSDDVSHQDGHCCTVCKMKDETPPILPDRPELCAESMQIVTYEGMEQERVYTLRPGQQVFTIGRGADNDLRITDDSKLSRYQCRLLVLPGGGVDLEDSKSACGTILDGELITRARVFEGGQIVMGETFLRVRSG